MELGRLGLLIKRLRYQNHLTQAELAEKADLSVNYIGDIENGRKSVSLSIFSQVSEALQIRADRLLKLYFEESEETMTVELNTIKKAYQNWKSLNEIISNEMDSRKVNLPKLFQKISLAMLWDILEIWIALGTQEINLETLLK